MPETLSRRPGTAYFTTVPTAISSTAAAATSHAAVPPTCHAQTSDGSQDEQGAGQDRHQDADEADRDGDPDDHFGESHVAHLPTAGLGMTKAPDTWSGAFGGGLG